MVLPHALAFHGEAGAARVAAESAIEAATELGGVYLGGIYISLMTSHLAAGDIALASDAADAGWPHLSSLYGTASINSAYLPSSTSREGTWPRPDAESTMPPRQQQGGYEAGC